MLRGDVLTPVIDAVTVSVIVLPDPAPANGNAAPSPSATPTASPPATVTALIESAPVGGFVLALKLTPPGAFTVESSMFASTVSVIVLTAAETPMAAETLSRGRTNERTQARRSR